MGVGAQAGAADRAGMDTVSLRDPRIQAELRRTPRGRRVLWHLEKCAQARRADMPRAARNHRRAAQRLSAPLLARRP
jgi:hypothetical protein